MRTETIYTNSRKEAVKAMPWAVKVIKVDGGYKGFESMSDYETWRNQR